MKKYFVALICLLLFHGLMVSLAVSAEESTTVKVGVYDNPPKVFRDENGTYTGFWPLLLEYIADAEEWGIEWVWGTWSECQSRLDNGTIDIMVDVGVTEARAEQYAFSNETVLFSWSRLYAPEGAAIESILELEGKRIGVLEDSINLEGPEGIQELMDKFEINCSFVEMNSYTRVFQALENRTIDAGVTNKQFGDRYENAYAVERTPLIFQPIRLQFAFPLHASRTPYLRERIDVHMAQLKGDKDSIYYNLQDRFFGGETERDAEGTVVFPMWARWTVGGIVGLVILFFGMSTLLNKKVKEKTEELRRSEEQFRGIFENAVVGIYKTTADGRILMANPFLADLLGFDSIEALKQRNLKDLDHYGPGYDRQQFIEQIERRGAYIGESAWRRRDGSTIWVRESAVAIRNENGETLYYEGVVEDITERKEAEQELREHRRHLEEKVEERTRELQQLNEQLQQANEHLQELDQLKSMFIASMSHELRTPLNSIIGFTGVLLQGLAGELNEEQRKQLKMVQNSSRHLLALINDVIDISKIEADKVEVDIEEFDLAEVVGEVAESFAITAEDSDVALTVDVPDELPVTSDRRRVKQVIMNYVNNAFKFTEEGKITVTARKTEDMAEIAVRDTGIGIPEQEMDNLFQAFSQIRQQGNAQEGTGLGLYLSKKIARLLGGSVAAESTPGDGSTFILRVPLEYQGERVS
ncbi:MAG: ATP-binding protein [Thermoplasmatota archaeon]